MPQNIPPLHLSQYWIYLFLESFWAAGYVYEVVVIDTVDCIVYLKIFMFPLITLHLLPLFDSSNRLFPSTNSCGGTNWF